MHHYTMDLEIYDKMKGSPTYNDNVTKLIDIGKEIFKQLNDNGIKITCFVTNDFLKEFEGFFFDYVEPFHEIGGHTCEHDYFINDVSAFRDSIIKNKDYIEKELGLQCLGFRSPGGIFPKNLPKYLIGSGFHYDSSLIPGIVPGRHFNILSDTEPYHPRPDNIYKTNPKNSGFIEFPMAVTPILRFSVSGFLHPYFYPLNRSFKTEMPQITYMHLSDYVTLAGKNYIWDQFKWKVRNMKIFNEFVSDNEGKDLTLMKLSDKYQ